MIAEAKKSKSAAQRPDLAERADAFFRPGGALARACAGEAFAFELRPQQRAMAAAVAEAVAHPAHLAVEAGTGVGKTFAYLVPVLLWALEREQPAAVSTQTINLQEQLVLKDLPFLRQHADLDFTVALCKGRSNYLCLRRLRQARQLGGDLLHKGQARELDRVQRWADATATGDLTDLSTALDAAATGPSHLSHFKSEIWSHVCSEHDNCLGRKCDCYGRCFMMRARARAHEADLLVLNHHLLFSELALRREGAGFLPDFDFLVVDEAHELEATASDHLGLRLSQGAFEHWLRRLYVPDANKGLLPALKAGEAAHGVSQTWDALDQFFTGVKQWAALEGRETRRIVTSPPPFSNRLGDHVRALLPQLDRLGERLDSAALQSEVAAIGRRGAELADGLDAFLKQALDNQVYWVECEGTRRKQFVLHAAPIEVAPLLKTMLFGAFRSVVMTSATLSVDGGLAYFRERVGAGDCRELIVGSPFDYGRQMRVLLADGLPDPSEGPAYADGVAHALPPFLRRTKGRAFVLFTSADLMRTTAEAMRTWCAGEGWPLLVQGEGLARHTMLERFKQQGGVLFGLDSFWTGVDVPGEALSNVIIARLPFAVPDEPVTQARMERIKQRGGDPFREYALPEAILKFRQGVGRLIRTASDEGIIVVLDPRIRTRWYGRRFLAAIPECPVEVVRNEE